MSNSALLASIDTAEHPSFAFTKVNRDRTSEQYALESVTVQGVTEDGTPVGMARIPVDEDGRAVISKETFGDDAERAWLIANVLEEEGWEYVEA
jgi:hypothetical protein